MMNSSRFIFYGIRGRIMKNENCPICNTKANFGGNGGYIINCIRCGKYKISHDDYDDLVNNPKANFGIDSVEKKSVISHALSKNSNGIKLTSYLINEILKNNSLPNIAEQANNLIVFLGNKLNSIGSVYKINDDNLFEIYAKTGFLIETQEDDLWGLIQEFSNMGLIKRLDIRLNEEELSLTLYGWQKYEELRHSVENSKKAFLAMEFYSEEKEKKGIDYYFQKKIYPDFLKKSVEDTGYKLENPLLDPKSGNIHARLEVEIRNSRFVIAELSHHNNGAYWEAGFARGLGKPVIYMYNKEIGETEKPHFDVGSDHIIFWEKDKPEEAAQKLKDCIRATLFSEAKMED